MASDAEPEISREATLYLNGMSIPQVSEETGIPRSTLRRRFHHLGMLRTRTEGVRMAGRDGRIGLRLKGRKRQFSQEHKDAIQRGRAKWGMENAVGVSRKPSGYLEYTTGEHKGRSVHVVKMEERLGRRLLPDEEVHHIDGNRANNDENNLALVTKSGHQRLHRFEDKLSGKRRNRENGRFC